MRRTSDGSSRTEGIVAAPTHVPAASSTDPWSYSNMSSVGARLLVWGARDGIRTRTPFRAIAFEAIESASCSTRACIEEGSEVRSREEVAFVLELVRAGWNDCEIARETSSPRRTIQDWRHGRTPDFDRVRTRPGRGARSCAVCDDDPLRLPQGAFTCLLGLYLGDGCISAYHRGVFRLRIVCADAYPELIRLCHVAMAEGTPNKVSHTPKVGWRHES